MKNILNKLIPLLFIFHSLPHLGSSQENISKELSFEVNRIYPYILITKEELKHAQCLTDLNRHYKSSWIREYISVEISTIYNGKTIKSICRNDTLCQQQRDIMNRSDIGTNISVRVKYIPENTLTHNDPKVLNFTFTIDPEIKARYPGEQQELMKYLKEKAIDKISSSSFQNYDLSSVKFKISEEGEIINAHIFGSEYQTPAKDNINKLLLETIRNMPCWKPAEYSNGTKVEQEFVLTVGNMENCMINLLNIQRNGLPRKG